MLKALLISMRPIQWSKNILIFTPLIFSGNLPHFSLIIKSILAFVYFCLLSSSIYIINDLFDYEQDRKHPKKKYRPIAQEILPKKIALVFSLITAILILILSIGLSFSFFLTMLSYFFLQILYSFAVKKIVILDILSISLGFLLRVWSGALVIGVPMSSWLALCTIFLALFLSLGKRRSEIINSPQNGTCSREALKKYNIPLIDQLISSITAATILSYCLYTIIGTVKSSNMHYTIVFVVYGIFRYLYLIYKKKEGENPELILIQDKPLIINIILYFLAVSFILYL